MTTIFDIPNTNPPNPFTTTIQALTSHNPPPADEIASHIATTVAASLHPATALYHLWDAFFIAVATSASHAPLLALLDALRTQEPTPPTNASIGSVAKSDLRSYTRDGKLHWPTLPRFTEQWTDVHDALEAWRDWDGVRASSAEDTYTYTSTASTPNTTPDKYYLRFCIFSAALLKTTHSEGGVCPIRVFYAARNTLERRQPPSRPAKSHRMPPEQVWALDVRVAATWVRDGGRALWAMDHADLRRHWAAALDDKTEMWPREDGLTGDRWRVWGDRLRALGTEGTLDEETECVVRQAAEVVEGLLGEGME